MSSPEQTLVVNLFARPSAGKSTMAAGVFFELKQCGLEFNHWHEPVEKIKALLGDLYL